MSELKVPREMCDAEVWPDIWSQAPCSRKAKHPVPTDRGDFGFCAQHLKAFKRNGVWAIAERGSEFIKPSYVILQHRDEVLGGRAA